MNKIMSERWQRWDKEELSILKKHFPHMAREDIMQILPGRSWRGIVHQAEKQKIHRSHYGTTKKQRIPCRIAHNAWYRKAESGYAPFAGKRHSEEAKLRISVSNLYARGHCIAYIAVRVGITEKEVKEIIKGRK